MSSIWTCSFLSFTINYMSSPRLESGAAIACEGGNLWTRVQITFRAKYFSGQNTFVLLNPNKKKLKLNPQLSH